MSLPRRVRRGARLAVAAVTVAAVTAGCGGSDDPPERAASSTGPGPTAAPSEPAEQADPPLPTEATVADEPLREAAVEAVTAVVRRDHTTYDDDVAAVLPLLTEELAAEFRRTAESVRADFVDARTVVTVEVLGAGVVQATPDGGQVLVLLDETSRAGDAAPRTTPQAVLATLTGPPDALLVRQLSADLATAGEPGEPGRAELVRAARDLVTPLLNTGPDRLARDVGRAAAFATGPLARSLAGSLGELRGVVDDGASLTGTSGAVGVESATARTASVLVAATVEVDPAGTGRPQPRTFRMRLELTRVGAGWRTRGLDVL